MASQPVRGKEDVTSVEVQSYARVYHAYIQVASFNSIKPSIGRVQTNKEVIHVEDIQTAICSTNIQVG